jgi:hypothetical protein
MRRNRQWRSTASQSGCSMIWATTASGTSPIAQRSSTMLNGVMSATATLPKM